MVCIPVLTTANMHASFSTSDGVILNPGELSSVQWLEICEQDTCSENTAFPLPVDFT